MVRSKPLALLAIGALLLVSCGQGGEGDTGPAAPSNVTTAPGFGYVVVTWQDNSDDEVGFRILREPSGVATSLQAPSTVGDVDPDVEEFLDASAEPGTTYDYSVVALGSDEMSLPVPSASTTTVPVGVQAMVGEANGPTGPYTATLVLLSLPTEGIDANDVSVTWHGPPGWNGDAPVVDSIFQYRLEAGWFSNMYWVAPVPGEYVVTFDVDGVVYEDSVTLAADAPTLPSPGPVTVTQSTASEVGATWDGDQAFESYQMGVVTADTLSLRAGYVETVSTSHTLSGLSLDPGSYLVVVSAYPTDLTTQPVFVEEFGMSFAVSPAFTMP